MYSISALIYDTQINSLHTGMKSQHCCAVAAGIVIRTVFSAMVLRICRAIFVWFFLFGSTDGLQIQPNVTPMVDKTKRTASVILKFKNGSENEDGSKSIVGSIWKGIKRFLPTTSRSRIVETYKSPQDDTGNRYEVRLINANKSKKRHTITRLRRYLPDLSWETAEGMVDLAINEGAALIRVMNSKNDVAYLVDMLNKADPPVTVEVYDTKKQEVIVI